MMPSCNDFKRAMMKAPEYVTHSSASLRVGHVPGSRPGPEDNWSAHSVCIFASAMADFRCRRTVRPYEF